MGKVALTVVLMISLPFVAFKSGLWLMTKMSNHDHVTQRTAQLPDRDRTPLNQRKYGYDADAVSRYWGALDPTMLEEEKCLLKLDLVFPLLYGGSFLASLLIGRAALGRPFRSTWLMVPVGVTILADWTENTVLLLQLKGVIEGGVASIERHSIQIASTATIVKLYSILVLVGLVLLLAAWVVDRTIKSAKQ